MEVNFKKRIYLGAWLVLGALLGTLIGEVLEYLLVVSSHNEQMENRAVIYLFLIFAGLLLGYTLGPKAWKRIYIDGARGKKYLIDNLKK